MRTSIAILLATAVVAISPDFAHYRLSTSPAEASLLLEMSLGDLVKASTAVVAGTPQEGYSVWEDRDGTGGQRIVTYTRVQVDQVLDGTMGPTGSSGSSPGGPTSEVWVRTLGGRVGNIGQHVDAEAEMTPFVGSVLFLHARGDGTNTITGMSQGHFLLTRSESSSAPRLKPTVALEALVSSRAAQSSPNGAHLLLAGKTIAEAMALIGQERLHAR